MSTITADEFFDSIHRIVSLLDEENIAILRTMKQHGPRNLLGIARKAKLPYTTVYNRVTKLEGQGILKTWIQPNCPKIGLSRAVVLATPHPGKEIFTREALKIPGFWLRIARCIGDCNGYYSLHGIPTAKKDRTWKFDWKGWLDSFVTSRAKPESSKQSSQPVSFDKKDLIILKELVKNARTTLADLSKLLSLTLPAAKYRFDRLVERGLIQEWVIDLLPYAPQVSELSEVRLDFKNENFMKGAENVLETLPIVQSYSPITGLNSITTRLYLPRNEVSNLHTFLSLLVSKGVLTSYSYLVIDPMTIQAQTFAYKDYNDDSGWNYASREYLRAVDNLVPKLTKAEMELTLQTLPSLSLKL